MCHTMFRNGWLRSVRQYVLGPTELRSSCKIAKSCFGVALAALSVSKSLGGEDDAAGAGTLDSVALIRSVGLKNGFCRSQSNLNFTRNVAICVSQVRTCSRPDTSLDA